jgi:hypothetical protein
MDAQHDVRSVIKCLYAGITGSNPSWDMIPVFSSDGL